MHTVAFPGMVALLVARRGAAGKCERERESSSFVAAQIV
jgi:hypothetical protein